MVESTLLEQVLKLDATKRRELRAAIDESLGDDIVPAEVLDIIDRRLAEIGPDLSPDSILLADDERVVRADRGHVA